MPRASLAGTAVAYLRKVAADTYEVRILDYASRQNHVLVTAEALSKFKGLRQLLPRWSRDSRYLFLSTDSGLLRIKAEGGSPEKFSFPVDGDFEVFSDQRKIVFLNRTRSIQPWLYDNLQ